MDVLFVRFKLADFFICFVHITQMGFRNSFATRLVIFVFIIPPRRNVNGIASLVRCSNALSFVDSIRWLALIDSVHFSQRASRAPCRNDWFFTLSQASLWRSINGPSLSVVGARRIFSTRAKLCKSILMQQQKQNHQFVCFSKWSVYVFIPPHTRANGIETYDWSTPNCQEHTTKMKL